MALYLLQDHHWLYAVIRATVTLRRSDQLLYSDRLGGLEAPGCDSSLYTHIAFPIVTSHGKVTTQTQ